MGLKTKVFEIVPQVLWTCYMIHCCGSEDHAASSKEGPGLRGAPKIIGELAPGMITYRVGDERRRHRTHWNHG